MNSNYLTITVNGKKNHIHGLPNEPVRQWDNNIKLKLYERGKKPTKYPQYTRTGRVKKQRRDTQIYLNGKYYAHIPFTLSDEGTETVYNIIKVLYICGWDFTKIKEKLNEVFSK